MTNADGPARTTVAGPKDLKQLEILVMQVEEILTLH
jgi:hypothetical protein